jgi:hypothetical protein
MQVLHLKLRYWRCVPHMLSDIQKVARVDGAQLSRQELLKARRRNWNLFMTGHESWILWYKEPLESWSAIDEELPVRVRETIGARKPMLKVFRNPNTLG